MPTDEKQTEFEAAGEQQPLSILQEFVLFVTESKKWWLLPILAALSLMGLLIALSATGVAPFIYSLF
jgi:hypothetical protein